ncbi:phage tail protein [Pseudomonas sp. NPDC086251]|uniref:phage tail protein n=1 Tax=Pseudomonas sp. NPDC086251 TaxID=3364431 RepID=UPI003836B531
MEPLFQPIPTSRFITTFIFNGLFPSPLDIAFQSVSGLSRELNVTQHSEGGENVRNLYFAEKISHGSLTLERGVITVTPLTMAFEKIMQGQQIAYADVVILLLNHLGLPVCSWTISNALPVRWQTANLDANASSIMVNTLELKYQNMRWRGIRA